MRLAIAIWNDRVSPVFDASKEVELLDLDGVEIKARSTHQIPQDDLVAKAACLGRLGVDVLICGAISQPLAWLLTGRSIRIIPFVTGSIEDVVDRFLAGRLPDPQTTMPGCCGRRWRSGRGKGWGWRFGY